MDAAELPQALRMRRLTTLALADQIKEDRWRGPVLPGGRTIHDLLAHLIAWDEWAFAVIDISQVRDLPPVLLNAVRDIDAYNAKHEKRMRNLTRDDMLSALQSVPERLLKVAMASGGGEWDRRRIEELAGLMPVAGGVRPAEGDEAPRAPSVRGILRTLMAHEAEHDQQIIDTFGIQPNLEQFADPDGTSS